MATPKLSSILKLLTLVEFLMNLCQGNRWRCMFLIKSALDSRFLYRQNSFLNKPFGRLLCNAKIQPMLVLHGTIVFKNIDKKDCRFFKVIA